MFRVGQLAKLGWQQAHSVLLPLHWIQAEGGAIACTLLLVQRKCPTLVRVQLPSGVVITQTPQAYAAAQSLFETQAANVSFQLASGLITCDMTDLACFLVSLQFLVPLEPVSIQPSPPPFPAAWSTLQPPLPLPLGPLRTPLPPAPSFPPSLAPCAHYRPLKRCQQG